MVWHSLIHSCDFDRLDGALKWKFRVGSGLTMNVRRSADNDVSRSTPAIPIALAVAFDTRMLDASLTSIPD